MITLGIDIGSTTSKCAVLQDGRDLQAESTVLGGMGTRGPETALEEVLQQTGMTLQDFDGITATGYGRTRCPWTESQASELTCHALGASLMLPEVRTVIDIGGQDAKVISMDAAGRMKNFLMNDKCAAGTGRFLDVMATVLQIPVEELGQRALRSTAPVPISSTCTVFAESEVISQLAGGVDLDDLAAGICASVAGRTAALAKRLEVVPALCMSGGVARNAGVRAALEKALGLPVLTSPQAQLFGAIGAARYAFQKASRNAG